MPADGQPDRSSGERSRAYRVVEGLHLRQWLARLAAPLAIVATNGSGFVDVSWLPQHDAPLDVVGAPAGSSAALRSAGVVLLFLVAWLRVQSKGVLVRRTTLTTGGVYGHVRHPFYLATILGGTATLLVAGGLGAALALAWLAAAVPVYWITIAGEEDGLRTLYPERWDEFAARVPRLFPIPGRSLGGDEQTRVTWDNLVSEHEPPRLLRFAAGAAGVAGIAAGGAAGAGLVAVSVFLLIASHSIPALRPPSRRERAA